MPLFERRPGIVLPDDQVTAQVGALCADLVSRLFGVATVELVLDEAPRPASGAWITPYAVGAVGVSWEQFDDFLVAGIHGCEPWELPRTTAGVATVKAVVDAAVTGAVEVGTGRGQTHYRVRLPDGSVLEAARSSFKGWLLTMPGKPRLVWSTTAPYA
ncbi:hypothetical protein [Cellulomonas sp. Root137]|uniref:hypothetical protein n=1 Tax=Cellulomonas sp. Root137 TaxID=1736459 RepID=UPI0006F6A3B0|nr:hypothetical protein [Cellulomonas sp. Root137]KQY41919.1 hypothetical protein ASD18_20020 [Cellulomonas sp. Root137]